MLYMVGACLQVGIATIPIAIRPNKDLILFYKSRF